jgi:hypothetical protein
MDNYFYLVVRERGEDIGGTVKWVMVGLIRFVVGCGMMGEEI